MGMRPGFKPSEVGMIPTDWHTSPCSAISDLITVGIVVRPTQYYAKQGVPALRSANIRADGINDEDMVFISEKANTLLSKSQVRTCDVLTVRTGYPGTSAVVPPSFAGSNCIDILITRPSKSVNSHYLSAWINSSLGKYQVLRNQGGLAQQHFNVGDLRNLVVALPPTLAEQKAIAEALCDVGALIESLEQLLAKKCQLKQSAMQELLTGRKRLPGFSGEWGVKALGDFADLRPGEYLAQEAYRPGPVPVQGAGNIMGWHDSPNFPRPVSVIGRVGTVGRPRFMDSGCWVNNNAAALMANPTRATPEFLHCILEAIPWNLVVSTTAQPFLEVGALLKLEFEIPDVPEQTAIAAILCDMDADIAALEAKVAKAREIKQGMMQELLTGRIRLL